MTRAEFDQFKPATMGEEIALALVMRTLGDDGREVLAAFKEICDRTEGKATQRVENEQSGTIEILYVNNWRELPIG